MGFRYYILQCNVRTGKPLNRRRVVFQQKMLNSDSCCFITKHPYDISSNDYFVDKVIIDVDNKDGYTREFMDLFYDFIDKYGTELIWMSSGNKGFNLYKRVRPFIINKSDKDKYKEFMLTLLNDYKEHDLYNYFDLQVSLDINRVTRIPFSKRVNCTHDHVSVYNSHSHLSKLKFFDLIYSFDASGVSKYKSNKSKPVHEFSMNSGKPKIMDLIPIKMVNGTMNCLCPFHDDKTPSAVVFPDFNGLYCATCNDSFLVYENSFAKKNECIYCIYSKNKGDIIQKFDCSNCNKCKTT